MKHILIKRYTKKNLEAEPLKSYPSSIDKIGIFHANLKPVDTGFLNKIKNCFGENVEIFCYAIARKIIREEDFLLNKRALNYLGKFKDNSIYNDLSRLDLIIDISLENSSIKNYAMSIAHKSFKIALGHFPGEIYNLSINVDGNDLDVFASEIEKYHKILSHVER